MKLGLKAVGWHAAGALGPAEAPPVITNITTDPYEVAKADPYEIAKAVAPYAVLDSNGTVDAANLMNRMPQLITLLAKYGKKWTYAIAVNDLWFDFVAPLLQAADIDPAVGHPRLSFAGDGSVPALQRIREKHYQFGTASARLDVCRRVERVLPAGSRAASSRHRMCSSRPTWITTGTEQYCEWLRRHLQENLGQ